MAVTITVNNICSRINGLKDIYVADNLDKITSYYVEGYQYSKAFRNGYYDKKLNKFIHWDGKKHLLTQKMIFPTGLLKRVLDFFRLNDIKVEVIDKRKFVKSDSEIEIKNYIPRQYQNDAVEKAIKEGRGILKIGTGGGKSCRIGTKIIKYDGSISKVEDLVPGDLLMGPDSKPRKVLSTNIQYGNIVKIIPTNGDPWYCNDVHILTLKHNETNEIIDISIPEYKKQDESFKNCYKQFSVGVNFPNNKNLSNSYSFGLNNTKVPRKYLTSSRANRMNLLAGFIDSNGYLHNNCYEIIQKELIDIAFLARSLGFKVIIKEYKICILGNIDDIPVKIKKKANLKKQEDPCKVSFSIKPEGQDYYIGIELDGDGRFLLEDFTVTHNTLVASMICGRYNIPTMVYTVGKDLLYQFHKEMEKSLGIKVGIIGDSLCDIRKINVCSIWTAATAFNLNSKVSLDDEDWSPEVISICKKDKERIRKAIEKNNLSIYDEAHFLATNTLQSIFKVSKQCCYHFGLSGTDWRDDGADLLLESVCGKRIYNMPSSKLINDGFLVKPKIIFFEVPRLDIQSSFPTIYNKYITNNDVRNEMIEESARKLINKGRKVLILVRYISHGKYLANKLSDIPLFFVNGEVDSKTRQEVKTSFEAGYLKCLIASSVFDIGVDIPSLDALILGGGGKSTVRAMQRIGRVIRSCDGKKNAIVVDFIDNVKYLLKHSYVRISVYETEPNFILKFPKGFNDASIKRSKKIKKRIQKI